MASERTDHFMRALQGAEQTKDVDDLVALFAEDASLTKLARPEPHRGRDGARAFWGEYLAAFDDVRSSFTHVTEGGDTAVLEWTSEGHLPGGRPLTYGGVSVLEWRDGKVRHFRTYYDSAPFVAVPAERDGGAKEVTQGAGKGA